MKSFEYFGFNFGLEMEGNFGNGRGEGREGRLGVIGDADQHDTI